MSQLFHDHPAFVHFARAYSADWGYEFPDAASALADGFASNPDEREEIFESALQILEHIEVYWKDFCSEINVWCESPADARAVLERFIAMVREADSSTNGQPQTRPHPAGTGDLKVSMGKSAERDAPARLSRKAKVAISLAVAAVGLLAITLRGCYSSLQEEQLVEAASDGNFGAVRRMIKDGIRVNATDSKFHTTALMWAARRDNVEMIEYLISNGANVSCKDLGGNTALRYALRENRRAAVSALRKAGARE